MIRRSVVLAVSLVSSFAFAQDAGVAAPTGPVEPPPSAELIKAFLDYQEIATRYTESLERGDTINDVVLRLLRERSANLVLEPPTD